MQDSRLDYKPCSNPAPPVAGSDRRSGAAEAFTRTPPARQVHVVRADDRLRLPYTGDVPQTVRARISRGERDIVLDLARVSVIDAAGVGDLVRAYNLATASHASFRIANANAWTRTLLERAGLFERLSSCPAGREPRPLADC